MSLSYKRSRDEMEGSDNDEPSMGRQILPVAQLPDDFDGEPMDGMQYLFTVRRDARKLPSITRVSNPYEVKRPRIETIELSSSRPRIVLPSEEWRVVFLNRFKNFRKNCIQTTIGVHKPPSAGSEKLMPDMKARDAWWAYINGRPEIEWNPPRKPKKQRQPRPKNTTTSDIDHVSQFEVTYSGVDETINGNSAGFVIKEEEEDTASFVMNEFGDVAEENGEEPDMNADLERSEMEIEAVLGEDAGLLPTPFATPQPESRYKASENRGYRGPGRPRTPTPALLRAMDNRYCTHLLMYFAHWIKQHLSQLESPHPQTSIYSHLSQNHARWMFALLAFVDEHLSSDELSNLRSLARACLSLIKDLNKNANDSPSSLSSSSEAEKIIGGSDIHWVGDPADAPLNERACWVIVTIISDFWAQRDLWMDAEEMLNRP